MSKELEALEELKKQVGNLHYINRDYTVSIYKIKDTNLFSTIETALEALEIIKETPIFAWYITIYKDAYEMVSDAKGFRTNNSVEELQEMFDLLKKVLKK